MPRIALLSILLSVLIAATILAIFLLRHPQPSRFYIKNADSAPVRAIVHWSNKTRDIGEIPPGKTVLFSVSDKAGISFEIARSNGTATSSGEIHFAPGASVNVIIGHSSINITTTVNSQR